MGQNYFNTLPLRLQLKQLGKCRFMDRSEFADGVEKLRGKKLVIVGCGAQGLNQGLNLRDSGLDVAYALRESAIVEQRQSWKNASENGFSVGTYEELIPQADLVLNLTPDKQHTSVVQQVMPLMKQGACLSYSHGFNIVEEGMQIREDLTVIMVAPKCPGTEVREEYKRGFGVPTLIAVHTENDPNGDGLELAKAYAAGTGGHRAGVLESSFIAEVKSDLMGEQTILCGMLQTGSLLCFDKMVEKGIEPGYASKLIQYGWETVTEGLKHGGITNMMDRLSNPAKIRAYHLSEELKEIMRPLYEKHQDDIMTGHFSRTMMEDWANDDANLLSWRAATADTPFEQLHQHRCRDQRAGPTTTTASSWWPWSRRGWSWPSRSWSSAGHHRRVRLLRIPARDSTDRQHHRPQEAVRDERGHLGHRRVRLLPVRPCLPAAAGGLHEQDRQRRDRRGHARATTAWTTRN